MAAGLGFKTFTTGEVLTAADTNGYLMQGILVFASAAARDSAITSPQEGQACYLKDTNQVLTYSGSAWVAVGGGSPLTTKGDLYTFSTVDARLGVGANNTVLTADSAEATGLKWAAAASGSGLTYVGGATFTTSSAVNVSDVFSTTYRNYIFYASFLHSVDADLTIRLRVSGADNSTSNYTTQRSDQDGSTTLVARFTTTEWSIYTGSTAGNYLTGHFYFPFETQKTGAQMMFNRTVGTTMAGTTTFNSFNLTTSFTGFSILPASGTITGSVRVYGLANS